MVSPHFGTKRNAKKSNFAAPYSRPSLALFNAHCDRVIDDFGLDQLHISARAVRATRSNRLIAVELSNDQVTKHGISCWRLGWGSNPIIPIGSLRIARIFTMFLHPVLMVGPRKKARCRGGGISAAQIALRLMKEGHEVHLMSRHELRQHQFDSDPGWLGPST